MPPPKLPNASGINRQPGTLLQRGAASIRRTMSTRPFAYEKSLSFSRGSPYQRPRTALASHAQDLRNQLARDYGGQDSSPGNNHIIRADRSPSLPKPTDDYDTIFEQPRTAQGPISPAFSESPLSMTGQDNHAFSHCNPISNVMARASDTSLVNSFLFLSEDVRDPHLLGAGGVTTRSASVPEVRRAEDDGFPSSFMNPGQVLALNSEETASSGQMSTTDYRGQSASILVSRETQTTKPCRALMLSSNLNFTLKHGRLLQESIAEASEAAELSSDGDDTTRYHTFAVYGYQWYMQTMLDLWQADGLE